MQTLLTIQVSVRALCPYSNPCSFRAALMSFRTAKRTPRRLYIYIYIQNHTHTESLLKKGAELISKQRLENKLYLSSTHATAQEINDTYLLLVLLLHPPPWGYHVKNSHRLTVNSLQFPHDRTFRKTAEQQRTFGIMFEYIHIHIYIEINKFWELNTEGRPFNVN